MLIIMPVLVSCALLMGFILGRIADISYSRRSCHWYKSNNINLPVEKDTELFRKLNSLCSELICHKGDITVSIRLH